jgi:small subunit ribosomal protein S6
VLIRENPRRMESGMNRTYELMFIVRPDMPEEDQDKLISTLETAVTSSGGAVKKVERMGKRRLAYTVRRFHEGIYLLLIVEGQGELVHELERRLRVTEPVIKFLTVRTDEEQKRLDKIKKIRDQRRKAAPAPAAVAETGGETAAVTA